MKYKIVCVSDTHSLHNNLYIPECDILIHSGDFCGQSDFLNVIKFCDWFSEQKAKYKIVVAGNHDTSCQDEPTKVKQLFKDYNIIYLEDEEYIIDKIKFYGSPWQPEFCNWAFNLPREGIELKEKWFNIPFDTDILITHGPPYGILDISSYGGIHVGCELLNKRINKLNLSSHIFGHVHEGYGTLKKDNTLFINASICTSRYTPTNLPIIFEIDSETKEIKL